MHEWRRRREDEGGGGGAPAKPSQHNYCNTLISATVLVNDKSNFKSLHKAVLVVHVYI